MTPYMRKLLYLAVLLTYTVAPNDKMKEVLKRTSSEAKSAISKVHRNLHCTGVIYMYTRVHVRVVGSSPT